MPVTGAARIGKLKKLYYSAAGLAVPTWVEQGKLQGGTLTRSKDVAEVKERDLNITTVLTAHDNVGYTFTLTRRPGDTFFDAIDEAYNNDTNVALAIMTGDITNSGERGYQAEFKVVNLTDNEEHTGTTVEVEIRPAADYTTAPAAVEISA